MTCRKVHYYLRLPALLCQHYLRLPTLPCQHYYLRLPTLLCQHHCANTTMPALPSVAANTTALALLCQHYYLQLPTYSRQLQALPACVQVPSVHTCTICVRVCTHARVFECAAANLPRNSRRPRVTIDKTATMRTIVKPVTLCTTVTIVENSYNWLQST